MALFYACHKFAHFLAQGHFIVVTDSKTVTHWTTMQDPGGTVRRWLDYLQQYSFSVVHKPGKTHVNADSLSRSKHLPEATPSERSEAADRAVKYPLPFPGWRKLQESSLQEQQGDAGGQLLEAEAGKLAEVFPIPTDLPAGVLWHAPGDPPPVVAGGLLQWGDLVVAQRQDDILGGNMGQESRGKKWERR